MTSSPLPEEYASVLAHLAVSGPIFTEDVPSSGLSISALLYLKEHKLIELREPNPNYLYLYPSDRQQSLMYIITGDGLALYYRLKEHREQEAQCRAEEKESARAQRTQPVEDKKREHRHDLKILILGALISFVLDLVNAFISAHF